ncbi:MAG TPA: 3-mercaptopyruvate sulfurtransferase [Caulobacteraceae bacterium]|nr:3-mercaptopyruvate sulfurtransferase [Caulobacteraceae bacterium]
MSDPFPDPIVSTAELAERLGTDDLVVIDATWFMPATPRDARAEYAEQQIPGAVFFDIDEISDDESVLPHMLPSPAVFSAHARRMGVNPESEIVVYDAHGLFSAARAWWSFRAMGHAAVRVLDGGLPAWIAEGRPLEAGERPPAPGRFEARPDAGLVRDLARVRAALAGRGEQLLDARSRARFLGEAPEPRPGLRSGHMPGALNLPFDEVLETGRLLDAAELRRRFANAGVDLGSPIVTTCGSGVTASVLALALARLGAWRTAVYDGSWSEWGARADTPIVTGS